MEKIKNVPEDLITGKDLDYLSDMFEWNYVAYKKVCNEIECISDKDIISVFDEATTLFDNNLNVVLNITNNPGGDIDE